MAGPGLNLRGEVRTDWWSSMAGCSACGHWRCHLAIGAKIAEESSTYRYLILPPALSAEGEAYRYLIAHACSGCLSSAGQASS